MVDSFDVVPESSVLSSERKILSEEPGEVDVIRTVCRVAVLRPVDNPLSVSIVRVAQMGDAADDATKNGNGWLESPANPHVYRILFKRIADEIGPEHLYLLCLLFVVRL